MAITNHYCFCVREILHLLGSQLIIDFPFVHSELVNDFMRVVRFFFPFPSTAGALVFAERSENLSISKDAERVDFSPASGILVVRKHHQPREMSLLKANTSLVSLFI